MNTIALCILFVLFLPMTLLAEVHEKVQQALDYQLPENTCKRPANFARSTNSDAPTQSSGSVDFSSGGGAAETSDTDSYTLRRLEKKEERWEKCVSAYKADLLSDMEELKSSAQYGLTADQANIIVGKMLEIQNVYLSPDVVIEAP